MKKIITLAVVALVLGACEGTIDSTDSKATGGSSEIFGSIPQLNSGDAPEEVTVVNSQGEVVFEQDISGAQEFDGEFPTVETADFPIQVILSDDDESETYVVESANSTTGSINVTEDGVQTINGATPGDRVETPNDSITTPGQPDETPECPADAGCYYDQDGNWVIEGGNPWENEIDEGLPTEEVVPECPSGAICERDQNGNWIIDGSNPRQQTFQVLQGNKIV